MDNRPLAGAGASSRFVTETQLEEVQRKRQEELRASYARLGKEVPEDVLKAAQTQQDSYDPRSLFEKLQAQRDAKQEAWDEKHKLANQFRGIDEDESMFLAEIARERNEEQRRKEEETKRELEDFRKATLAARDASPSGSSTTVSLAAVPAATRNKDASQAHSKPKGKRKREGLAGIVRKKPATFPEQTSSKSTTDTESSTQDLHVRVQEGCAGAKAAEIGKAKNDQGASASS